MRLPNGLLVVLALGCVGILARPTPVSDGDVASADRLEIPPPTKEAPASDILHTIANEMGFWSEPLRLSGGVIEELLQTAGDPNEINNSINNNLRAITRGASLVAAGVVGDLNDAADTLTGEEAFLLSVDAQIIHALATDTASLLRRVADAPITATNTELSFEKRNLVSTVHSIINPLYTYVIGAKALPGSDAELAVANLKDTVVEITASIGAMLH